MMALYNKWFNYGSTMMALTSLTLLKMRKFSQKNIGRLARSDLQRLGRTGVLSWSGRILHGRICLRGWWLNPTPIYKWMIWMVYDGL